MVRAFGFILVPAAVLLIAAPAPPVAAQPTSPFQALCDEPDNPAARPAPWKYFPKLNVLQRCAACPNLPGNDARLCNPGGWDCAGSTIFAPGTGSSCGFASIGAGTCHCPMIGEGGEVVPAGAR
jgi:hypothetical protein